MRRSTLFALALLVCAAPATLAHAQTEASGETYTIRAGDTLAAIARRNDIALRTLMQANPGIRPRRLQIGQVIQLPGAAGSVMAEEARPAPAQTAPLAQDEAQPGPGPAQSAASALMVTPPSGPAGTTVEMRGQGFAPGEQVRLVLSVDQQPGAEFAAVEANAEGRIAVRMAIPEAVQPGQRLAFAAVGANGTRPMDVFLVSAPGTQAPATTQDPMPDADPGKPEPDMPGEPPRG